MNKKLSRLINLVVPYYVSDRFAGILFKEYAGKSINDVIGNDQVNQSAKLFIQTLSSSLLINEKNNNFKLVALPAMAQTSPIFTILTGDFDKDDNMDIFAGGNFFEIKPDIGRLDGNTACFLHGDGKGSFSFVPSLQSGLQIKGQVRDAAIISVNNAKFILLARNNDAIIFLQVK